MLVFCSSPAMAKLWPLPSSIVVSARRTVSAGMVSVPPDTGTLTAPLVESWLTSGRTRRLSRVGDSTVGTTARLTPNCLEFDRDGGLAVGCVAGDRDRELAAGQEARGLARLRREVRLRQDGDELIGRQRIDDAVDVPTVPGDARRRRAGWAAGAPESGARPSGSSGVMRGIGRRGAGPQAEAPGAAGAQRLPVEAKLPRDLAVDLGDADPDVDLDAAQHGQVVDHAGLLADIAAGNRLCLLRRDCVRHRPGEDRVGSARRWTRTPDAPCTVRAMAAWIASAVAGLMVPAPPLRRASDWCRPPAPGVTVTSYWTIAAPASVVAITVVRPGATPIRNRLVGEAGCTRATPGSADITVAAGCGRRSSTPVPACTVIG